MRLCLNKENVLMKSKMFLSLMFFIKIYCMKIFSFSLIITAVLTFLMPSFAQENTQEEYIVKLVYFVSKDREPQKNIDTQIRKLIEDVQKFYTDQMENYGYGRKTFRLETDANGKTVVHHVIGKKDTKHYQQNPAGAFSEFANRIQTRNTILFVVLGHGSPNVGVRAASLFQDHLYWSLRQLSASRLPLMNSDTPLDYSMISGVITLIPCLVDDSTYCTYHCR